MIYNYRCPSCEDCWKVDEKDTTTSTEVIDTLEDGKTPIVLITQHAYCPTCGEEMVCTDFDSEENEEEEKDMENTKKPLGYLGGDIMTFGSNLARQYEYDKFLEMKLPVDVYSPVQNKSINDKSNMTEEENNHLAEKIVEADVERLWNSDFVVMCPEQSAIGSMCETGILYGWKYMCDKLIKIMAEAESPDIALDGIMNEIYRISDKQNYYHYFDIRTNHLNEKDWRRSFSINQFLYGCVLLSAKNGDFETFEEIMQHLEEEYGADTNDDVNQDVGGDCLNDL